MQNFKKKKKQQQRTDSKKNWLYTYGRKDVWKHRRT